MSLSNISPILNPPQPAPPADPCPDCGCTEWAWDGVAWYCAICHLDLDDPDLEAQRDTWLDWGKAHQFPRLPYGFWVDHHPILGDRQNYYKAIAPGRDHWRGFLARADAATLDLVATAAKRYEAQHARKEAA